MIKAVRDLESQITLNYNGETIGYVFQCENSWLVIMKKDNIWIHDTCNSKGTVVAIIEMLISRLKLGLKVDVDSVYESIKSK